MSNNVHPVYCGPETISHPINIVNLLFCVLWLIVLSVLGYYGFQSIKNGDSTIPTKFRYIFATSFLSAVISAISYIFVIIFCYTEVTFGAWVSLWMLALPYQTLLVSVWYNLLFRLESSFSSSVFAIKSKVLLLFKCIGIVAVCLGLTQLIMWLSIYYTIYFGNISQGQELNGYESWLFSHPLALFYILGTELLLFVIFAAVFSFLFVNNIIKLIRLSKDTDDITLNHKQRNLVNIVAKIVLLSSFAFSSTVLLLAIIWYRAFNVHNEVIAFPVTTFIQLIDMAINVTCVYLQYTFSNQHYQKVCAITHSNSKSM